MTHYKPGTPVPATGIYWCSVCKTPVKLEAGTEFPRCLNLCGRGLWELVEAAGPAKEPIQAS